MSAPIVFIDGDQGTTGLQIHERLRHRTDLRVLTLAGAERKDPQRPAESNNTRYNAILCLPNPAASEAVSAIVNPS
ncbi:MAG: N-acetyl-gamma-glutamyl-phosphate reductase, partial [Cupriavidus sp.]